MNADKSINSRALNISTISTIALIAVLTISSEVSKEINSILTSIAGYHWVSKSIISIIFFVIIYIASMRLDDKDKDKSRYVYYSISSAIICGFIIFLFYLFEFFI